VCRRVLATYPNDAFLNRGWLCELIIIGLVVMTLPGAARSGASGSDSYLGSLYSCP
jgi:hypothetical protein